MAGQVPFIDLNGQEIANYYRTASYLQRGLGPLTFNIGSLGCLVLAREIGGAAPFVSPAADPAPWYDATIPESGEFLGFVPKIDFQFLDVKRSISQRFGGIGGGVIGVEQFAAKGVKVEGILIASTCAGLEYGRHWLYSKLGADCAGCALGTLRLRESCPPDNGSNDPRGERIIYDAAVVDGITRTDDGGYGCCEYDGISFQMAGQSPYLYSRQSAATSLGDVQTSGGVIPPLPAVLDTFVRANTGPPPSANWTGSIVPGEGNTLRVLTNLLDNSVHTPGTAGSAWWNAATFGPDFAMSILVPTRVNQGQFYMRGRIVNPGNALSVTYVEARILFGTGAALDSTAILRNGPASGTSHPMFCSGKQNRTFANGDTFLFTARGGLLEIWRLPTGAGQNWIRECSAYDSTTATVGFLGIVINEQGATQDLSTFAGGTLVNGVYPKDIQSLILPAVSIGVSSPIVTVTGAGEAASVAGDPIMNGVRIQLKPLIDGGCSISDDFSVNNHATKWYDPTNVYAISGGKLRPTGLNAGFAKIIVRSLDGTLPNRVLAPGGRVEAQVKLGATLVSTGLGSWGVDLWTVFGAFLIAQNNIPATNIFALVSGANSSPVLDSVAFTPVAGTTYRIICEANAVSPAGTWDIRGYLIDQSNPTVMLTRPLRAVTNNIGGNLISAVNPSGLMTPAIESCPADVNEEWDNFFFIDYSDAAAYINVAMPAGTMIVDASRRVSQYTPSTNLASQSTDGSGYLSTPIDTPLGWPDVCAGQTAKCLQIWGDAAPSGANGTNVSVATQNRVR